MLLGYIKDKRNNKKYGVKAHTTIPKIDLYFCENEYSTAIGDEYRQWFDGTEYLDFDGTNFRRLVVNFDANKYKTNFMNYDLASEIAGTIKFTTERAIVIGKTQGLDDIGIVTKALDDICKCEYKQGILSNLSIDTDIFEIRLTEIMCDREELLVFKAFKEKDNYGNLLSHTPVKNKGYKISASLIGIDEKYVCIQETKKSETSGGNLYATLEEVFAAHPGKNYSWIADQKYVVVTDDILEDVIREFKEHDGPIAFDTETTGLKINFLSRTGMSDVLTGVVLCKEEGVSYYFPLKHNKIKNLCDGDDGYFMEKYMRYILENKTIIAHNTSFDWKVAYIYGINVNVVFDTLYAIQITLGSEYADYSAGLKALAKTIFDLDQLELGDFVDTGWGDANITFADLPLAFVKAYAPADGDITLRVFNWAKRTNLIEKYNAQKVLDLEVNFGKVVGYSEFYGYRVNTEAIPELKTRIMENMSARIEDMKRMIGQDILNDTYAKFGKEFNPNSTQQLCYIMYDRLGYKSGKKQTTSKDYLKELSLEKDLNGEPRYPLCGVILDYRINENIYKNFLVRLDEEECRKANAKGTGKKKTVIMTPGGFIFPEVNTMGAATGRVSVKEPNYQSYNDTVKKYITPRKDYIMVDCDFSQIEQRVLASMAQEITLMDAMNDSEMDYHQYQASRMFSVPYAAVTKSLRQQSKGINFGLPYGMGDGSLGARIFGARNKETEKKAAELRKLFFEGQERIEKFFKVVRDNGVAKGYTETYIGRRRYYRADKFSESAIRRQAGNAVIQGTAADIYKEAVVRMFNRVVRRKWLGLVLFDGFIHDELLMEVHNSIDLHEFIKVWKEEYQLEIEGFCNLYAGFGVGTSWYSAKKQDLPPLLINHLIENYETGKTSWDGNQLGFIQYTEDERAKFDRARVLEYLTNTEYNGTILKPAINVLMREFLFADIKPLSDTVLADLMSKSGYTVAEGLSRNDLEAQLTNVKLNIVLYRSINNIPQDVMFINADDVANDTKDKNKGLCIDSEEENQKTNTVSVEEMQSLQLIEQVKRNGYYIDEIEMTLVLSEEMVKKIVYSALESGLVKKNVQAGYKISMLDGNMKICKSQLRVQSLPTMVALINDINKYVN